MVRPAGTGQPGTPLSFSRLVSTAVSVQQANGWGAPDVAQFRQGLPGEKERLCFDSLHQLIAGETAAAVPGLYAALRGSFPPVSEVDAAVASLRQANLPVAANTLAAVCHADPSVVILAFAALPEQARAPVATYLYDRYNPGNNPMNFMRLGSAAMRLFTATDPVADPQRADGILRFINLYGFGNNQFNEGSVSRVTVEGKNPAAGRYLLGWLLRRYPDDTTLQATLLRQCTFGLGGMTTGERRALLRDAVTMLPPHYGRRFRTRYDRSLAASTDGADRAALATLQQDPDALIAAEAHLAQKAYAPAAERFGTVLADGAQPLPRRLAAWSGLWDAAPDAAVAALPTLTDALLALPSGPERTVLLRWFGGELGRVAPALTDGTPVPKAFAPACYAAMAASLTRLLAADPVACLRTENQNGASLRYAGAIVCTLAQQGAEANAVMARTVTYDEPPRAGTHYAPTAAALSVPRSVSAPIPAETELAMQQFVETMTEYDRSLGLNRTVAITPEPPNTQVIADLCAQIAASTDPMAVRIAWGQVGRHLAHAISYLDPKPLNLRLNAPPPPARAVHVEYLAPIRTALLRAVANPVAAQQAYPLISEGFQPAMLTASNPELLDGLFSLSVDVLDRCAAVKKDDALLGAIRAYAGYLGSRQVWDLKPYMVRLQERYLDQQGQ